MGKLTKKVGRGIDKVERKLENVENGVKQEVLLNVPNSITLLRLILVFVFVYMLFNNSSKLALGIVFGIAAATDWFDGFFARKLKQTSSIGARMDQIVDRVFTVAIVIALIIFADKYFPGQGIILMLFLISSREIIGLPAFLILLVRGKDSYKVRYIGKVTTFVQSFTLGFIILGFSFSIYFAFATCVLGILAGIDYMKYALS